MHNLEYLFLERNKNKQIAFIQNVCFVEEKQIFIQKQIFYFLLGIKLENTRNNSRYFKCLKYEIGCWKNPGLKIIKSAKILWSCPKLSCIFWSLRLRKLLLHWRAWSCRNAGILLGWVWELRSLWPWRDYGNPGTRLNRGGQEIAASTRKTSRREGNLWVGKGGKDTWTGRPRHFCLWEARSHNRGLGWSLGSGRREVWTYST